MYVRIVCAHTEHAVGEQWIEHFLCLVSVFIKTIPHHDINIGQVPINVRRGRYD